MNTGSPTFDPILTLKNPQTCIIPKMKSSWKVKGQQCYKWNYTVWLLQIKPFCSLWKVVKISSTAKWNLNINPAAILFQNHHSKTHTSSLFKYILLIISTYFYFNNAIKFDLCTGSEHFVLCLSEWQYLGIEHFQLLKVFLHYYLCHFYVVFKSYCSIQIGNYCTFGL